MVSKRDPTAWLDNAFFEKVLRQALNDRTVVVEDFFINLHTNAGEQYSSTIYRANVSYLCSAGISNHMALVIKLISSKVNQLADATSFENELNLYKNLLSQMQNLLVQAGEKHAQLAPRLLYASTEPQPVMILEDITRKGYELHKSSMNFENAKLVAEKLALFHATSYFLAKDVSNKALKDLTEGLFRPNPSEGVRFMEENFGIFTEEIAKWKGFEKYADKFVALLPNFMQRGINVYSPNNDKVSIKVLNHGDFHYNNMLVKFHDPEKTSAEDILFIDFQLSFWGTPAVDLYYLLYLVCNRETRETHRQDLIHHYHRKLVETLEKIGHVGKVPTLMDIQNDLLTGGFLEVVIAVCFIPFLFADYGAAMNVYDNTHDAKAYRRALYNNAQYREIVESLLPQFLHKGFLD